MEAKAIGSNRSSAAKRIDVAAQVLDNKAKKIKVWPVHQNRASEAGHPCERYLYYQRTAWEQRVPHAARLQFIFDGGNYIEHMALDELREAGFRVVEMQRPFRWKEFQLTGHIDARLQIDGALVPLEIKGYNHRDWVKLNDISDFLNSKQPWHKTAVSQLLLYMMMAEEEWGLFYLKSKATFEPKSIWVNLYEHLEYTEAILQKLTRVNEAVARGEPPAPIEYDDKICSDCGYFHLCKPDVRVAAGAELINDEELLHALERREALKPLAQEYKEVDDYVKKAVKGIEKAVIGNYLITGKLVSGERKPSPGGHFEYWRTDIKPLGRRSS